jgi:HSP20 family protein
MIAHWNELERTFAGLEQLRRMLWEGTQPRPGFLEASATAWPRANFYDAGDRLLLVAEVPGLSAGDISINATQEAVSIAGARKAEQPSGYSVHRRERAAASFARTFALPCKVDLEKTTATVKDGLLTLSLAKAPESRPRQISVKAG